MPRVALPPAIPFTLHVTDVSGLPDAVMLTVKTCDAPGTRLAEFGARLSATSLLMLTAAVSFFVGSAWLVAVIETIAGAGKIRGAV